MDMVMPLYNSKPRTPTHFPLYTSGEVDLSERGNTGDVDSETASETTGVQPWGSLDTAVFG